jgi:hypothetical protein
MNSHHLTFYAVSLEKALRQARVFMQSMFTWLTQSATAIAKQTAQRHNI